VGPRSLAPHTRGNGGHRRGPMLHPADVGRGIGSQLLEHAIATMPLPIRLYTFQPHVQARKFYERHGFVAIEFTDGGSNEEGVPDVLYELSQAPERVV
jgi:GNAT superfamily N-acetyltransferase